MATNSNAIKIHELFRESCVYQMPLFQRPFQWSEEVQLKKFWEDLTSLVDEEVDISFLGAIVLQTEREGDAKSSKIYTVIDGQQRITTFFLFLCAIVNFARKKGWDDIGKDTEAEYLTSKFSAEAGKAKLIPTIRDNSNFNEVIKQIEDSNIKLLPDSGTNDGPLVKAFRYFMGRIEDFVDSDAENTEKEQLESLQYALLQKMEAVQIILDKSHNANEVFDRLNTAGRPLSVIDLIRNELFQTVSADYDDAKKLYDKHWYPFEKGFEEELKQKGLEAASRSKIIDGFFFPYALTQLSTAKKNNLLADLRKVWLSLSDTKSISPVPVIQHLEHMKAPYLALDQGIRPSGISDAFWDEILNLRRVPIPGVTHPYFMKLISEVASKKVADASAIAVCKTIESFFVRRGLVGLEPTGLHAIFKRLWETAGASSAEVSEAIVTGTISFPSDEELKEAILIKGLYRKRIEKFVLASYEIDIQKKSHAKLSYLPKMTTDHVMPQELTGGWKAVISSEEHDEVKHLWGNLVPLSSPENSAKGSKSFAEAKVMLSHETAFLTTKRLLQKYDAWDRAKIIKRSKELGDWAVKRWPR